MKLADAVARRLLLSFRGIEPPAEVLDRIQRSPLGGVTLYSSLNVKDPEQVAALTSALQAAAMEGPLVIGTDQEGGQLTAIGQDTTPFPGNLALGAAGSTEFARETGECIGRELAAMGINLNYAPVCDVNSNPLNPVVGARSFGEDPTQVSALAAALVSGLQSVGVAATAKHFPGHGDTSTDSHFATSVVAHNRATLNSVELPPFRAAIDAGTRVVMIGHLAVPAVTGSDEEPATISRKVVTALLREELGFDGVVVSDALDMAALQQGVSPLVAAAKAGIDLLLMGPRPLDVDVLLHELSRGLTEAKMAQSADRVLALKRWIASQRERPPLSVVGCAAHREVANSIAEASITVVRGHSLPLRVRADQRVVLVLPRLANLSPADTSGSVQHTLPRHVRRHVPSAATIEVTNNPSADEIDAVLGQLRATDVVVVCTSNAFAQSGQAQLVRAVHTRVPDVVVVALRMPYDLGQFPQVETFVCTYSALEPSMRALADVLFGHLKPRGRLPVSIPGLYPIGHRDS